MAVALSDDQWFAVVIAVTAQLGALGVAWLAGGSQAKREQTRFFQTERRQVYARHHAVLSDYRLHVGYQLQQFISRGFPADGDWQRPLWDEELQKLDDLARELTGLNAEVTAIGSDHYIACTAALSNRVQLGHQLIKAGAHVDTKSEAVDLLGTSHPTATTPMDWLAKENGDLLVQLRKDLRGK